MQNIDGNFGVILLTYFKRIYNLYKHKYLIERAFSNYIRSYVYEFIYTYVFNMYNRKI